MWIKDAILDKWQFMPLKASILSLFWYFWRVFSWIRARFLLFVVSVELSLMWRNSTYFGGILSVVDVTPSCSLCLFDVFMARLKARWSFDAFGVITGGFLQEFRPEVAPFRSEPYRVSSCNFRGSFRAEYKPFRSELIHSGRNEDHSERNEAVQIQQFSREFSGCNSESIPTGTEDIPTGICTFRPESVARGRVFRRFFCF